ncbi:MAG: hypothetical protein AB8B85_00675 [Paracoccaceae bacterium]
MDLMHIGLSVLILALVLALHVSAPPPPRTRRISKHLRPYDELRLTNL